MRVKHKLTEFSIKQAIKKANSSTKTIKISGGGGMYLQIQPNGSKYWRMNCRINGKQITLSFGVWPEVSLAQARMMQEESQESVGRGINPIEEKREQSRLQLEEMLVKETKEDILKNTFNCLVHCLVPFELYLIRKISLLPELVFPSSSPSVYPVT